MGKGEKCTETQLLRGFFSISSNSWRHGFFGLMFITCVSAHLCVYQHWYMWGFPSVWCTWCVSTRVSISIKACVCVASEMCVSACMCVCSVLVCAVCMMCISARVRVCISVSMCGVPICILCIMCVSVRVWVCISISVCACGVSPCVCGVYEWLQAEAGEDGADGNMALWNGSNRSCCHKPSVRIMHARLPDEGLRSRVIIRHLH